MTLRKLSKEEQPARINLGSAKRTSLIREMIEGGLMEILEDDDGQRVFVHTPKGRKAAQEVKQLINKIIQEHI